MGAKSGDDERSEIAEPDHRAEPTGANKMDDSRERPREERLDGWEVVYSFGEAA